MGDLRRVPDRLHVPDADRHRRPRAPRRGARWRARRARRRRESPTLCHEGDTMTASTVASRWRGVALALAPHRPLAQKKYGPGATDTEIKHRPDHARTAARRRPTARSARSKPAYFKMINDAGRHQRPQDQPASASTTATARRRRSSRCAGWSSRTRCCSLFQTLGTPSNSAIHKYMNAKKVPQLFLATGATKWDDPKNFPWTMGFNPSYQTEGADLRASTSCKTKPNAKIAVLYQNDDYGKDFLKGFKDGLGRQGAKHDRRGGDLRGHRPDGRLADRARCRARAPTPSSTSPRRSSPRRRSARRYDIGLEAAALPEQRRRIGRLGARRRPASTSRSA